MSQASPVIEVRVERDGDDAAVAAIHTAAFGRPEEARLVARLREQAQPYLALVADLDGRPVGHVVFSPVTIRDAVPAPLAIGLGPLAVLPEHQRHGIGGALVLAGLAACVEAGLDVVFVLGHPSYYPRFGFRPAAPHGLYFRPAHAPALDAKRQAELDAAFMVAELVPGALGGATGRVEYHPAFDEV
jgi:putative acetyltransferase